MTLDMPDNLKTMERAPALTQLTRAGAMASTPTIVKRTLTASPTQLSQTFADILNNAKKAPITSDDNDARLPDESAIGYLNRHHQPAAARPGALTLAANPSTANVRSTAARPGESAVEAVNSQMNIDEAADRHAQAEKAAEGLVSNALILPILKQVRRSAFSQNSVFSGGNGEKSFGPEFDMQLSDRIAKSPRLAVKNALVARLEKHGVATHKPTASLANKAIKANVKEAARLDING